MHNLLTVMVFLPLLGMAGVVLAPSETKFERWIALLSALSNFLISSFIVFSFLVSENSAGFFETFFEKFRWIPFFNINYVVGIDGLSAPMIFLVSLIMLLAVVASWDHPSGKKGYFSLLLLLESSILGTYVAQDMFLFFMFWLLSILPVYFILAIWGHKNKGPSSVRFFLFQLTGAAFFLLAMLTVYYLSSPHSFGFSELRSVAFSEFRLTFIDHYISLENSVFILLLLCFFTRLPVFPIHGWFLSFMQEAPTVLGTLVSSVFVTTGVYGILKINFMLFPQASAWFSYIMAIIAVVNILYAGVCAFGQNDLRRLMAYCSISHIGFLVLGLASFSKASIQGCLLQTFSYGIYVALLFFLIGILCNKSSSHDIKGESGFNFGGLVFKAPYLTAFFSIAMFAAVGIPGLAAFPGRILVFIGGFSSHKSLIILSILGIFLTSGFLLWTYRAVFLGKAGSISGDVLDLTVMQKVYLLPLIILCVLVGVYPLPLLRISEATVSELISRLTGVM